MGKLPQSFALVLLCAAGSTAALASGPDMLQPGDQVRGEITSADQLNHSDGTRSKLYRVTLGGEDLVSFEVSGSLRAQLSLFDGHALVLRSADTRNERVLSLRAPENGEYLLAVSGADADAFGPYTLSAKTLQAFDGRVLGHGDYISDWLDGARELSLRVDREGLYTIDMRSDDFDAMLALEGNGISASDDDGGEGSNARLQLVLPPGRYALNAQAYAGHGRGFYQLAVNRENVPRDLNQGGQITPDRGEVRGLYAGTPLQYRFRLSARRVVTIDMRSDRIDPLLTLSGGGEYASDDDGGDGLNARLVRVLEAGEYTIEAGAAGSATGLFTLAVATADVPEGMGGGPLEVGQELDTMLMPGASDRFTVTVEEAGEYVIAMGSSQIDSYLRLLDADGDELASDDDGGGGLDARIRTRLEPGQYTIEASELGSGGGRYTISFRQR